MIIRARWEREIGWDYINAVRESGKDVHPDDLPPALGWEGVVWELYALIFTQWRYKQVITGYTAAGVPIYTTVLCGLDYNPAIALMQQWQWPIDFGLKLLQAIETEMMRPAPAQT